VFAGVLVAVLLFGSMRLAFFPPSAPTVRVAALAPDRKLNDRLSVAQIGASHTATERAAVHAQYLDPLIDDLFARTRAVARSGVKIVAWSEAAAVVFKADEAALLGRASTIAHEEGIYLELGLIVILPTDHYPFNENRAILLDPSGRVVWDYAKSTVPLHDGNAPGSGIVPTVDTPYGRLATVICYDADFPALVQQAGQAHADMLLVPASDWPAVAEMHARMAIPRAVENGLALIRSTRQGTSLAVDHQGRLLGYKADYFVGDDQTMIVNVPTRGVRTIDAVIGAYAGCLYIVGLVALAGVALFRRRTF
jgi:apolipoprotein N-acyltransferase